MNVLRSTYRGVLFALFISTSPAALAWQTDLKPDDSFELRELEIPQLQKLMESGKHSSKSLTQLYLDRIEAIDRNGYQFKSVIEINPGQGCVVIV